MMHIYSKVQRHAYLYALAVWLVVLTANFALAQQAYDQGIIRIKVSDELAQQLETSFMNRDANNIIVTGIQSIDAANVKYRVSAIKRVFRPAGKFEAKHRRYGLHKWYEIRMDQAASIMQALSDFGDIENVEVTEPSFKKKIIGSDNPNFGPVIVEEKKRDNFVGLSGPANDPMLGDQWHYNNTGQQGGTPGSDIDLFQAWGLETGTSNVIVAVTDGGAQVDHPDLAPNMWVNTGEIPGNGSDDDGNGYVDDINGYGFGDDTGDIFPDDHGTHTSGTVAAVTNNGVGVAGVAGGSGAGDGARIMTLAAFGGVGTGGFAETYVYGADMGAVISQNSWGYTNPGVFEQAVLDGIDYFVAEAGLDEHGNQIGPMRGGIVIFAAGNDDTDAQWYPGFYGSTLAVGALNNQDKKAWYSNFGTWVDMSAPGGETFFANDPHGVLSTVANNQYAFFQGTSMACPHVSGVAALIVSKFGGTGFTPEMLRGRLVNLVDEVDAADPDFAGLLGTGRLNAFKALQEDDGDAPDVIADLAASDVAINSVTLNWTSPADPGNGSASVYDLRYATFPITIANYETATQALGVPAPQVAGSAESFTIYGLSGGVTYYFAIKSADFFGNFSDISNVVAQATNFPPVADVSPASLSSSLETAETTTLQLTIINTGLGPLEFNFEALPADAFATPTQMNGTVAGESSLVVDVVADASGLLPGTYNQDLIITNNDAANDTITVPVTLEVITNGQPIASVDPATLDFGQLFESASATLVTTVHNAGAVALQITNVQSTNGKFTTDFVGPMMVDPFQDFEIAVTFTPGELSVADGIINITTNDPDNTILVVEVTGEGVPAPDIVVSPTSLSSSLNTDRTETQSLTISNTGGSDLQFTIEVGDAATTGVASTRTITIPVNGDASQRSGKQKAIGGNGFSNQVEIKSVAQSAAISNVLIITPDENVTDVETILDAFEDVEADVFPKASLPSITLADIEGYDIVYTTNNTQWLAAGGIDPGTIGDLLADYIDAGGKVISNQFAYSYDAWRMEGRFIDEQYGPFTPSTTDANITVSLGTILDPGHPVAEGLTILDYSGFVQNVGLAPGATAIAEWSNGELFLAANDNVVALNMLPSLGNGGPLQWSGDLALIYQNAVHYLSGPGFVSVAPKEGTVASGTTLDLEVTFDATGLDAGVYEAAVNISTNVPGHELVQVPVVLNVLGPEFVVSPTSLSEELEKDQTSTQIITLSNNGPDDQTFSVDVQGLGVGASATVTMLANEPPQMKTGLRMTAIAPAVDPQEKIAAIASNGQRPGLTTKGAIEDGRAAENMQMMMAPMKQDFATMSSLPAPEQASAVQYATDFEDFAAGDIDGQQGWAGQWGNWTINSANPLSGSQHLRGLSDGFGLSLAFSPDAPIGVEEKSTTSMRINAQGSGVTWHIIPQSTSAESVNTRIQFDPSGTMSALVSDGAGGASYAPIGATPSGYFDLTIEVDRDSAYFTVFVDGEDVFTGQGFAGNIEEVVVYSLMEVAGPTLDIDDFSIIDGEKIQGVPFLDVSPASGDIPSGTSVQLMVTFNSNDLDFGTYDANININVGGSTLTVPASLRVFGAPQIDVDPTVLIATVDYKEDTIRHFTIENTGGNPLDYTLQVFGAETEASLVPVAARRLVPADEATKAKLAKDERLSREVQPSVTSVQMLSGAELFSQNFDGGTFPPTGWSVTDNAATGLVWDFSVNHEEENYSGTGEAATVSSDRAGTVEFDTELISPTISTAGFKNISVQYNANYQNFANLDFLDLDIQVDGGAWTTVLRWNEDHGAHRGTPGETVTAELGSFIGNGSTFRLRWHYYDPNSGDWDWYAQIDDVVVYGDPRAWLSVSPASGTIPVNESTIIEAAFDAEDLEAGSYLAAILVFSNAEVNPVLPVVAQLNVRTPAVMSVSPDELYQELLKEVNEEAAQTITIANSGASVLKYAFGNTPLPASESQQSVPVPSERRTTPSTEKIDFTDIRAMVPDVPETSSVALLATGFEDFSAGDINGQQGWIGQFSNWMIEAGNPYEGLHHIRSLSDGLGATRAFSPLVAIGTDPISSASVIVDPEETVTWQIIPQSPAAGFVNTRIQFGADGALSVLVSDGAGGGAYVPVPVTLPDGYFEVRIDVERATSQFTLFIDGTEVFTAPGFAGDIEQIVLYAAMEIAGPVMDVDNLAVYDGPTVAPWLTYNPKAGYIAPGGSATITVSFNSTALEPGIYSDTLKLSSNDPSNSFAAIPVTLNVLYNTAPEIAPIDTLEVIELGTANVTFTATDVDGESITVELMDAPAFVSLVSSGDGTAIYEVAPGLGDAGEYLITVQATDARGKHDSAYFHLFVIPYGVESFTLINTRNDQEIATFRDTLELDVTTSDLHKLTVRANTNPSSVGSVKFEFDNRTKNTDNSSPYLLRNNTLRDIDDGDDHFILGRAFTRTKAKGDEGQSLFAVIRMVNAAMVTDFDVVKPNGQNLGDLDEGTTIDISNPSFRLINVKANTRGGVVKSVVFYLNDRLFRVDNLTPYQLGGFGTIIDLPLPALPGDYKVSATPYSEHYGRGIAGQSLTVNFTIVDGDREATAARERGDETAADEPVAERGKSLGVYPVPVRDQLNIELVETTESFVSMRIMNVQGVQVYEDAGQVNRFTNYKVDTNKLGLVRGVYFVHIQYADGRKEVRKFIKE